MLQFSRKTKNLTRIAGGLPKARESSLRKYSPALVVSLWVMALAVAGTAVALRSYRISIQSDFIDAATLRVTALQRNLDEKLLILQSMHSLYAVFDGKPQPQFRSFVQPFEKRLEGVQALQWVVPVRAAERDAFEKALQSAGIAGYQITERNVQGEMVRAGAREMYFPIYPLLPLDEGEASIGFDVGSTPARKIALEQAIQSRALTASGRIALLQDNGSGKYGFFVFDPLFAKPAASAGEPGALIGLVLGVFRISNIVEAVAAQFAPEALRLEIRDTAAPAPESLLSGEPDASTSEGQPINWLERLFMPPAYNHLITVAGRPWEVRTIATHGYMAHRQPVAALLVLLGGVLLSLVLSIYLKMRAVHERSLQRADQQRELLENQLFRSQRLEAIGQLVGGVAHDFNNLLNSILGNVELLNLELTDARSALRSYAGHIERAAERGNGLIQKLLSFSRNQPTVPKPQDLAPLIENTLAMLRPLIPASISFDIKLEQGLPPVMIDPTSFDQILVNLCINARDAINGAGKISVKLLQLRLAMHSCLSCHAIVQGDYVMLELTDTGSGIDADTRKKMFDPFFTTKAAGKGTGLGLSIVHNIVHGCGGHILLESVAGQGTTFRILFPPGKNIGMQ